ncbi:MAG: hypothetical protein AABW73_04690 [Nanoarchaeota archaeon]
MDDDKKSVRSLYDSPVTIIHGANTGYLVSYPILGGKTGNFKTRDSREVYGALMELAVSSPQVFSRDPATTNLGPADQSFVAHITEIARRHVTLEDLVRENGLKIPFFTHPELYYTKPVVKVLPANPVLAPGEGISSNAGGLSVGSRSPPPRARSSTYHTSSSDEVAVSNYPSPPVGERPADLLDHLTRFALYWRPDLKDLAPDFDDVSAVETKENYDRADYDNGFDKVNDENSIVAGSYRERDKANQEAYEYFDSSDHLDDLENEGFDDGDYYGGPRFADAGEAETYYLNEDLASIASEDGVEGGIIDVLSYSYYSWHSRKTEESSSGSKNTSESGNDQSITCDRGNRGVVTNKGNKARGSLDNQRRASGERDEEVSFDDIPF